VTDYPVKVPPGLFTEWLSEARLQYDAKSGTIAAMVADKAAQWGADQELEACVEQVDEAGYPSLAAHIRASRRPQPPSLKKQALAALNGLSTQPASRFLQLDPDSELAIRLALEALPND